MSKPSCRLSTSCLKNLFFDMQEFISLAGAEVYRGGAEREKRIYPGGPFDPLGLSKVCSPLHPAC